MFLAGVSLDASCVFQVNGFVKFSTSTATTRSLNCVVAAIRQCVQARLASPLFQEPAEEKSSPAAESDKRLLALTSQLLQLEDQCSSQNRDRDGPKAKSQKPTRVTPKALKKQRKKQQKLAAREQLVSLASLGGVGGFGGGANSFRREKRASQSRKRRSAGWPSEQEFKQELNQGTGKGSTKKRRASKKATRYQKNAAQPWLGLQADGDGFPTSKRSKGKSRPKARNNKKAGKGKKRR